MPPNKTIVDRLRKAIVNSDESEYAIARGSGISQSVVNRFTNGQRGISLESAARLCTHLKLDLVSRR